MGKSITLVQYEPSMQADWDEFVDNSCNGTIFHKQRFLSYHPDGRFKDASLVFVKNNKIIAVFPAAEKDNCLLSHPGSSFGGVVFSSISIKDILVIIDKITNFACMKKFDAIEMILVPAMFFSKLNEVVEFALFFREFLPIAMECGTYVSVKNSKMMYNRFQRSRKAHEKGVIVRESDDWEDYWIILRKNLLRHKTVPTHSFEEIVKLRELFPEHIKLFGSYYDEKLIAGTVLFFANSLVVDAFYISQDYDYNSLHPVDVLISTVIKWASDKFEYLNFGISTERRGRIVNLGLSEFKEGFGGGEFVRRIYRKELRHGLDKDWRKWLI